MLYSIRMNAIGGEELTVAMKWPHNTGAMTAWMAECGGTNCTQFEDLAGAEWFKIDEKGIDPSTGDWYLAEIFCKFVICCKIRALDFMNTSRCSEPW